MTFREYPPGFCPASREIEIRWRFGLVPQAGRISADPFYPEECWHCGSCRLDCPEKAVSIRFGLEMLCLDSGERRILGETSLQFAEKLEGGRIQVQRFRG